MVCFAPLMVPLVDAVLLHVSGPPLVVQRDGQVVGRSIGGGRVMKNNAWGEAMGRDGMAY
jgi:hypothetical protein